MAADPDEDGSVSGRLYALESDEAPPPRAKRQIQYSPVIAKPDPDPEGDAAVERMALQVKPLGGEMPPELYQARVTVVAALRTEGYTFRQIAKALGMKQASVEWCARRARERDQLRAGVAEAIEMLDNEAVPLAVDAMLRKLKKGEDKAVFGVLEGRGLLKSFSQVKNEGDGTRNNMAFQFVFAGAPEPGKGGDLTLPKGLPGQVVGTQRVDED
ncbi:MAG: hypothetical protein ABWY78_06175 [Microvirga sp.]